MSKNIKEQIIKSINLQNNNFVDKDNITQSFQPRNAYLLPKTDGTHERFVTDDNNVISKQAGSNGGSGSIPLTSDNYYGLWSSSNQNFVDGLLYINDALTTNNGTLQLYNNEEGYYWQLIPDISDTFTIKLRNRNNFFNVSSSSFSYNNQADYEAMFSSDDLTGNRTYVLPDKDGTFIVKGYNDVAEVEGDVKANSYKFVLPQTIIPQPNMLIPKVDGSGLVWYNNNSVANNLISYNINFSYGNGSGNVTTNTAYGNESLKINTTGSNNTAVGNQAMIANTTGGGNTAIGSSALGSNITSGSNTAVGHLAGYSTTGNNNTFLGSLSGRYYTGSGATFIGSQAGGTGSLSVAVGYQAGTQQSGGSSVYVGYTSGSGITTGSGNTVMGRDSLGGLHSTSSQNVAIGQNSMLCTNWSTSGNTSSNFNTCIGYNSGNGAYVGDYNVFIGHLVTALNVPSRVSKRIIIGSNSTIVGSTIDDYPISVNMEASVPYGKHNYKNLPLRFQLPNFTKTQRDALASKTAGEVIWQTDDTSMGINVYDALNNSWGKAILEKFGLTTSLNEKINATKGVNTKDLSFTLQSSITPTPNTLVPKTDGSRPTWYDNNSIAHDLAFNKDLTNIVDGTTPPIFSRSANTLVNEVDSNGWPKQIAWVSEADKRLHVADTTTGQSHETLDTRDLKTHGVADALIKFARGIYDGTFMINTGVFVSMQVSINYGANPRQITLKFTINSDTNILTAKDYKLRINSTTSGAQVDLDFATATLEGTTVLVFTFNDTLQMDHTTSVQSFEIYKEGVDESGVPSINWVNEYKANKTKVITITADTTISEIHNGNILHVTNSVSLIYAPTMPKDFNCTIKAFGNITVRHMSIAGISIFSDNGGFYQKNGAKVLVYCPQENYVVLDGPLTTT